jgi:ribosome maturation factor RimP
LAELAAAGSTEELPKGVPVERLSGVTHEDCAVFAQDFGTVLDVEDLIPGAEYTLEVSSPGLERKLFRPEDFTRFQGSLIKLQTFTPVNSNRQWQGRLTSFSNGVLTIDLSAIKQKGKAKKAATEQTVEIALANVEKANLVPEI